MKRGLSLPTQTLHPGRVGDSKAYTLLSVCVCVCVCVCVSFSFCLGEATQGLSLLIWLQLSSLSQPECFCTDMLTRTDPYTHTHTTTSVCLFSVFLSHILPASLLSLPLSFSPSPPLSLSFSPPPP